MYKSVLQLQAQCIKDVKVWVNKSRQNSAKRLHYLFHKVDEQIPHIFGVGELRRDVDQRSGQVLQNKTEISRLIQSCMLLLYKPQLNLATLITKVQMTSQADDSDKPSESSVYTQPL